MPVRGRIERVSDGSLIGWAGDKSAPNLSLNLDLMVDGRGVATILANQKRGDLQRAGFGEGMHGFEWPLPLGLMDGTEHHFAIHLAGTADAPPLAEAILLTELPRPRLQGKIERYEDGRLVGWVWDRAAPSVNIGVELLIGGEVVAKAVANQFRRDLQAHAIGIGDHGFSFEVKDVPDGVRVMVRVTEDRNHWVVGTLTWPMVPDARPTTAKPTSRSAAGRPRRKVADLLAGAREAERNRDFAHAAVLLDEALQTSPKSAELLFLRGRVALALNDTVGAAVRARAVLNAHPDHIRAIVILARLATTEGNHAEAIELWSRVGPGENAYRERLMKRGRLLLTVGRPLEALAEFLTATRSFPGDRLALRNAAEAAESAGGFRSAILHWRRFLSVVPDDKTAQSRLRELASHLAGADAVPPMTEPSLSPVQNPWLRDWSGPVQGEALSDFVETCPGVRLRMRTASGRLSYAAAAPSAYRPGDPPDYGIWLHANGGEAELCFALRATSQSTLVAGLEMAIEIAFIPNPLPPDADLCVVLMGSQERPLLHRTVEVRNGLFAFDLRLSELEAEELAQGRLNLVVRLAAQAAVVLRAPRAVRRLDTSLNFVSESRLEDASAMAGLRRLGLLPAGREGVA